MLRQTITNTLAKIFYYLPKGTGALILIQIFSTFSFGILNSTLVLYVTDKLGLSDEAATGIIASFFAFNYVLHLLGGYMGGRFFSNRTLLLVGMLFQICGALCITIPALNLLYWGLASFVIGTGTSTTCINCMITRLYAPDDKRRETAFLIDYSGVNIIYFIGFGISGYYQLYHAYQTLFSIGAFGTVLALALVVCNWSVLNKIDARFSAQAFAQRFKANFVGGIILLSLVLLMHWLFQRENFTNTLVLLVSLSTAVLILYLGFKQPNIQDRNKIFAYLIFSIAALIFWTLYQIAPMALTLFVKRNVDPHYLGFVIAPQWVRNVNSIVVMIGAPLVGIFFNTLRARGYNITISLQFSVALILIGTAFGLLPLGIHFAAANGMVAMNWIVASYFLQSIGELFISPIGYAMVGQLAPANLQGLLMGTWLMLTGIASALSWYFSSMALGSTQSINPILTNPSYSHAFMLLAVIAIFAGLVLYKMIPIMQKLTLEKASIITTETPLPAVV